MTQVTAQIHIDAPKEKVWDVLADLGGIYKWNPGVVRSHSTSEQKQGVGATRHCDLQMMGGRLEERAVEWREGEGYTIDVYESSLPMKNKVDFSIEPADDGTRVSATVDYQIKYGPLGALLDVLVVRRQVKKGFTDLLAGLKHYVETGEEVGDKVPVVTPKT